MVRAAGVLLLVTAVLGIVYRSGGAQYNQKLNRTLLGIKQSLTFLKVVIILAAIAMGYGGVWLIIGSQEADLWEQQGTHADRVALAVFVALGSFILEVILLVVRRRWTQIAIESGDRFFGYALTEPFYHRVNIGASAILVALVIWGTVELLRLLL